MAIDEKIYVTWLIKWTDHKKGQLIEKIHVSWLINKLIRKYSNWSKNLCELTDKRNWSENMATDRKIYVGWPIEGTDQKIWQLIEKYMWTD